jgi:hypothetical protein
MWSSAVILDKNGNKVEYIWSIDAGEPIDLTNQAAVAVLRQKLVDAAHASGLYPPYTSVACPNGGEVFWPELATNIVWDTANLGGNVRIELYKAGVLNSIIAASVTNTGTYPWSIPAALAVGTDYKIRVIPLNSTNQFDDSNANFTVRDARITVSCPRGGETFWPNLATNIVWDNDKLGGNVKIELYKADVLHSIVTASATNTGTYPWILPADLAVATDYKIRVIRLNSTNQFDDSDANFAIRAAKMTVYYPNGGEKLFGNDVVNITWNSESLVGNVDIDLYKSNSLYSTIAASTANDRSHTWTIPAGLRYDTTYKVKVTPQVAPSAADSSDAVFQITPVRLAIYSANMSTNPGWTLGTGWAYGTPSAPDPTTGCTGSNVVGYVLGGNYENSLTSTRYVTTKAIDCRGYTKVELQFMRWLGVESSTFDHAYVQVSSNNSNWVTVWQNSSSTMIDGAWVPCNYDISATADGQATVYIRWGMGRTDGSGTYCGWNIDDVRIVGVPQHTTNWTPYVWLASNGITNNQEAADLLDSDGDGALNWQEYLAGTSPTNAKSVFRILDTAFTPAANSISWYGTTNSGVTTDFLVYRTTNLVGGSWAPVGTSSRSPSGTNVWSDTSLPQGVPVYYRLELP